MKKKNNKNNKKIIILVIIVLMICIIFSLLLVIKNVSNDADNQNMEYNDESNFVKGLGDFKSIKEILEFCDSKYIKEQESENAEYDIDIFVEFKNNLYENNNSQERYFLSILNRISYFVNYDKNYILIDQTNNIEIKVSCDGSRMCKILINGEEDYYIKHDNKISLEKYGADTFTDLRVQSEELENVIDNKWRYKESIFGSKESSFNKYNLFWDEGIKVREIQNNVYNIVFNSKYEGSVVNGIKVQTDFDTIIQKIGEPTFGNSNSLSMGYKTKDFYIFFSKNEKNEKEISIYRNIESDVKSFEDNVNRLLKSEIDIKDFMNNLTYLWPDYEEYDYSANHLKILYPDKGVKIEYGSDTLNGIFLYENYSVSDISKEWMKNGSVHSKLEESLFLECELERLHSDFNIFSSANYMFSFTDQRPVISNKYMYSFQKNSNGDIIKIFFISKDDEYCDKELNENITSGLIISDDYFLYGVENKGIYMFNMITNEKSLLIDEGTKFYLNKFEDNVLYYDDEMIVLELE